MGEKLTWVNTESFTLNTWNESNFLGNLRHSIALMKEQAQETYSKEEVLLILTNQEAPIQETCRLKVGKFVC